MNILLFLKAEQALQNLQNMISRTNCSMIKFIFYLVL